MPLYGCKLWGAALQISNAKFRVFVIEKIDNKIQKIAYTQTVWIGIGVFPLCSACVLAVSGVAIGPSLPQTGWHRSPRTP